MMKQTILLRNAEIVDMVLSGINLKHVAEKYKTSEEQVRQIMLQYAPEEYTVIVLDELSLVLPELLNQITTRFNELFEEVTRCLEIK